MERRLLGTRLLLAGFCVLALGSCTARGVRPKSPLRKTGLLFPPDRCVVNSGEIQIAVVDRSGAEPRSLTLDGHSLEARTARLGWPPAETVKHSVLFAKASLAPGEHRIKVGDEIARMLIKPPNDGQPAPDGWRVYRPHPPPAEPKQPVECTTCHEITESGGAGEAVLGRPQTPDNCFQRTPQRLCVKFPSQPPRQRHVVRRQFPLHLLQEPQSLLGKRQR